MSKKTFRTLLSITIIAILVLYLPIFIIFLQSINKSELTHEFTGVSFKWFIEIFKNDTLFSAIKNTWIIAILSTMISVVLGTTFAIGISFLKKKHKRVVLFLNNIPIINADIVSAIVLFIIFGFLPLKFGFTTLLMAHIFFSMPFVIISVLPKLDSVNKNLYDAAIDLGLTRLEVIIKVILPNIKSGIIIGALIAFTMSIDDFVISYFNTGNGFDNVSIWIYSRLSRKSLTPSVYAYNTIIIMFTILIVIIFSKFNSRKRGKQ